MSSSKGFHDWDEPTHLSWFNSYLASEWFEMSQKAKERNWLKGDERKFLFDLGIMVSKNKQPSFKQLKKAKYVVDQFQAFNESADESSKKETQGNKMSTSEIKHITVRMAWHDNKWNGRICCNPENNEYCVGEYSLLSRRIRENRDLMKEQPNAGQIPLIDKLEGYQPPCYWSINAFGSESLKIEHENPAADDLKKIQEVLPPFSVFTWPFKLSFVRDPKQEGRDGKYPANLESRIDRFLSKFKESESIVFLYTNYDNPISGEEQKYLLVGCGVLKEIGEQHFFEIPPQKFELLRKRPKSQNFPRLNWALRLSFNFPSQTVLLPYHEYLEDAEKTNDDQYLNEMKVIVDEPELVQCFKYVAMDVDDDQAIYLLTKIKRSLYTIKEHGRFPEYNVEAAIEKIEDMLKVCWQKRGHFPGFEKLVSIVLDRQEGEKVRLYNLIDELKKNHGDEYFTSLLDAFDNPRELDASLKKYEDELLDLIEQIEIKEIAARDFLKLSMLNLNTYQFRRIWKEEIKDRDLSLRRICENPYVLFEAYSEYVEFTINTKTGEDCDARIELFKIDIALFPDIRYLKRFHEVQNLNPADKRRIRALVVAYLKSLENRGDCFDNAERIEAQLQDYPLFYKTEYTLPQGVCSAPHFLDTKKPVLNEL